MKKRSDTKARSPLEGPVFYLDECVDCHSIVTALKELGIRVERRTGNFPRGEDDRVWIPEVSKRGWLIITKDKDPQKHPIIRDTFVAANAIVFILAVREMSGAEMAEVLRKRITKMARLARNTPHPCLFRVTADNVIRIHPRLDY